MDDRPLSTDERVTMLKDRMPCIAGARHTFDAGATTCLCGALGVGVSQEHPHVVLYFPASAPRTPCPVCPHWMELHNPDGTCGCGAHG